MVSIINEITYIIQSYAAFVFPSTDKNFLHLNIKKSIRILVRLTFFDLVDACYEPPKYKEIILEDLVRISYKIISRLPVELFLYT